MLFLALAVALIVLYIVACKLFLTEKRKSKFTAMNKVINYVYKNQKLPENLEGIKNSSRYFGISNFCIDKGNQVLFFFFLMDN